MRRYRYVGSDELKSVTFETARVPIASADDILAGVSKTGRDRLMRGSRTVTFIVDIDECLWMADRTSEHLACAQGQEVLAAGEMTFQLEGHIALVDAVTNQSTGYCPEPESWSVVERVLDRIGIEHPGRFTDTFIFRRCPVCQMTNIIKDNWFFCAVCSSELSASWNFA